MSQDNKVCKICNATGHSKFYCKNKPIKPIKHSPIKRTPKKNLQVVDKSKPKKPKTKTRSYYIKQLDKVFSQYIRQKDAIDGISTCVTCGDQKPYQQHQCGHYYSRSHYSTRWDETNCHCQCLTEDSNIRLFNGKNKSISQIKLGDELWAFNEKGYGLEKSIVENVSSFVPDKLYKIEMVNGNIFYATSSHKVVSNGKWVAISDMLHNVSAYDILEI